MYDDMQLSNPSGITTLPHLDLCRSKQRGFHLQQRNCIRRFPISKPCITIKGGYLLQALYNIFELGKIRKFTRQAE